MVLPFIRNPRRSKSIKIARKSAKVFTLAVLGATTFTSNKSFKLIQVYHKISELFQQALQKELEAMAGSKVAP